jgi:hypothetical protein
MDLVRRGLRLLCGASDSTAAESYNRSGFFTQTIIFREQPTNIGVHYAGSVDVDMMSF